MAIPRQLIEILSCSASLVVLAAAPAFAQTASSGGRDATTIDEVVVTGVRASLQAATEIKRNSDVIVDSIASEDLGKFPDANVAESLQRITGVSISRNNLGEGSEITVRGFGPAFNTVLINGRTLPSQGAGRQFSFDALPAELISGANVYKSSAVNLQGGGIGSTTDLKLPRPFDVKGSRGVLSAKGEYEQLSGKAAPSLFGLYSFTSDDERWGALIAASYQRRNSRTNSGGVQSYLPGQTISDTGFGGSGAVLATDVFFPRQNTTEVVTSELSRKGLNGSFQFRPNDKWLFTVDALWNRYEANTETYQLSHYFTPNNVTAVTLGENRTVTALTTNGNGHTDFTRGWDKTPKTVTSVGFNTEWRPTDDLQFTLDVSQSLAHSNSLGKSGFAVVGYPNVINWSYDGSGLPSLTTSGIPGSVAANDFTDPNATRAHFMFYGGGSKASDRISEIRLDGAWTADRGILSKVRAGGYYSDRNKRSNNLDVYPSVCSYCGYYQPIDTSLLSVYDAGSDFLGGGNYPTQWLTFDPDALVNYLRTVSGNPSLYTAAPAASSYEIQEKITGAYLVFDFKGETLSLPWTLNLGGRYERTQLTSAGNQVLLTDLLNVPGDPTIYNGVYANGGQAVPVVAESDYSDFLPAANLKVEVRQNVIARLSWSRTLTRPNLSDLSPALSYSNLRPASLVATAGNPDLKPYRSENWDASLEWYYAKGGVVSAAVFRKQIQDYIVQSFATEALPVGNSSGDFPGGTANFRVKRPRNVESATVTGVEIAFQHNFDYLPAPFDGLGLTANATFVDSPATLAPGETDLTRSFALEGVGNSQNLVVFYEKGRLGMRAAYNRRDLYLQTAFNGEGNEPLFVKAAGQLDLQLSFRARENLSFTLEGSNVTNTKLETFGRYENQFIGLTETGPRYLVGVRANF